jgi:hypothetical protein
MDFEQAKIVISEQRMQEILDKLEEPFDPELIYFKPQAINKPKDKAVAAAYADPRAYSDRLNEVVGAGGWSCHYEVSNISPISGPDPKDWKNKFIYKGKVMVVATITIKGVGQNSGTGESDAVDENAITSAEAQAFKRAATRFGLGRYLYDLPKNQWVPYDDSSRRIIEPPQLPDWAIPKRFCTDCKSLIEPYQHGDRVLSITDLITNSQRKYKRQLCAGCQQQLANKHKNEMSRAV